MILRGYVENVSVSEETVASDYLHIYFMDQLCLRVPDERSSTLKNDPRHRNSILDFPSFTEERSDDSLCVASELSSVSVANFWGVGGKFFSLSFISNQRVQGIL